MCAACCPGVAALTRGALGNLTIPAFAPATVSCDEADGMEQAGRMVILRGGPIITLDDDNPVGEALAIRGGAIVGVGTLTEIKRHYTQGAEIVDLEGRAVLPGFVEPHVHVLESALAKAGMLVETGMLADSGRLAETGTDQGDTRSARVPESASAEGACHPASVKRVSPESVEGERPPAPAAAGIAREAIGELFEREPERVAEIGARMLRELAMRGCTTVYDTGIGLLAGAAEHRLLHALARAPDAPVRVRGAFVPELAAALGATPGGGDERYDVVGISYWADGSIQDFAAALGEPYLNDRGSGALTHEGEELCAAMRRWHDAGWQLVVHADGDRATEQVLRCYEALADSGMLAESVATERSPGGGGQVGVSRRSDVPVVAGGLERLGGPGHTGGSGRAGVEVADRMARLPHRIEHFAVVHDEQIARAAALGISVSHTINQIYYLGQRLRDEVLGRERAAQVHSLRRDFDHGLLSSCHSDSPAAPVDPCLALRTATTRLMRDSDDVLGPFQQLKLEEALRTLTVHPAQQVLLGDRVGALRPGMLADLVVLDRDPRAVAPERLHELRVLETWLGGRRQRWG
ncbi:MAG TPA: amidohydrolase family protein [Solirubrobacteraceae bacterium]|jgi:predicted amidohydrolase YtcJ|nr:amidohydrolase family protein [Solirubrobacteraceae bacterium]